MRITDLQKETYFTKRSVSPPDLSAEHVFPSVYKVVVKIQPEYRWRLVEEYGPESFVTQPDGSLIVSCDFSDRATVVGWIASFGSGAELLEPKELRQDILQFGEGICKNYLQS